MPGPAMLHSLCGPGAAGGHSREALVARTRRQGESRCWASACLDWTAWGVCGDSEGRAAPPAAQPLPAAPCSCAHWAQGRHSACPLQGAADHPAQASCWRATQRQAGAAAPACTGPRACSALHDDTEKGTTGCQQGLIEPLCGRHRLVACPLSDWEGLGTTTFAASRG